MHLLGNWNHSFVTLGVQLVLSCMKCELNYLCMNILLVISGILHRLVNMRTLCIHVNLFCIRKRYCIQIKSVLFLPRLYILDHQLDRYMELHYEVWKVTDTENYHTFRYCYSGHNFRSIHPWKVNNYYLARPTKLSSNLIILLKDISSNIILMYLYLELT